MTATHASDEGGGFFTALGNDKPYFKIAFQGFAGSGKTFTMAQLAIGLHARLGSTKPIVYFDTEKAAKFLLHLFAAAGVQVLHKPSRSLADLKESMRLARTGMSDILLIDSISHVWEDYIEAYKKAKKRDRLQFEDWGIIKPVWKKEFSDPLVNDPTHILFTGRAGYEYEDEKDENGKRQIYKSGIKMKVEGETAYEPDLLVLMERCEDVIGAEKHVWREAMILKDRSQLLDGKTFRNPTVKDFMPAIESILSNPSLTPAPAERDSGDLFRAEEDTHAWKRRRDIALEEVEGFLTSLWPGQAAEMKRAKVEALELGFATRSWTAVSNMRPADIEKGLDVLRKKYTPPAAPVEAPASAAPKDSDAFPRSSPDTRSTNQPSSAPSADAQTSPASADAPSLTIVRDAAEAVRAAPPMVGPIGEEALTAIKGAFKRLAWKADYRRIWLEQTFRVKTAEELSAKLAPIVYALLSAHGTPAYDRILGNFMAGEDDVAF